MSREDLIQLRGGTAAAWTTANPVLAAREPGLETDTDKVKYGDGTTAWNALAYAGGGGGAERPTFLMGIGDENYAPGFWGPVGLGASVDIPLRDDQFSLAEGGRLTCLVAGEYRVELFAQPLLTGDIPVETVLVGAVTAVSVNEESGSPAGWFYLDSVGAINSLFSHLSVASVAFPQVLQVDDTIDVIGKLGVQEGVDPDLSDLRVSWGAGRVVLMLTRIGNAP